MRSKKLLILSSALWALGCGESKDDEGVSFSGITLKSLDSAKLSENEVEPLIGMRDKISAITQDGTEVMADSSASDKSIYFEMPGCMVGGGEAKSIEMELPDSTPINQTVEKINECGEFKLKLIESTSEFLKASLKGKFTRGGALNVEYLTEQYRMFTQNGASYSIGRSLKAKFDGKLEIKGNHVVYALGGEINPMEKVEVVGWFSEELKNKVKSLKAANDRSNTMLKMMEIPEIRSRLAKTSAGGTFTLNDEQVDYAKLMLVSILYSLYRAAP